MTRIALIHAVYVAIEPISSSFKRLWPQAQCVNLIDDALPPDLERAGVLDDKMARRIHGLATLAADAGADGILYTCSAFGSAIDQAARSFSIPILKPNAAMFQAALEQGKRIGMLATFAPSVASMEELFLEMARDLGVDATLDTYCVPDAIAAAKAGDIARHDRLVAEAAPRFKDHDAILLAHFSTSTARVQVEQAVGRAVLTAPDAAVMNLRKALAA
jgi:Asp/Glu/hydantoin racemase